ncbi:MAG: hypothetical protein ACJ8AW_30815 [Rhodopila sp.]
MFNKPLGTGAVWGQNQQLSSAGVVVNASGNWEQHIYTGTASDPVVMVNGTAIHIPANAAPSSNPDMTLSIDDQTTGTWYSIARFNRTGSNSATAATIYGEPDTGNGLGA